MYEKKKEEEKYYEKPRGVKRLHCVIVRNNGMGYPGQS